MNKIQLEATLQLAEIDCENNPTPVNKTRVAQAKAAFDAFLKAQEEPAAEPQKPSKPAAAPKKASAPATKKEKVEKVVDVVPGAAATTADASDEDEETDPDATAENADGDSVDTDPEAEKKTQE